MTPATTVLPDSSHSAAPPDSPDWQRAGPTAAERRTDVLITTAIFLCAVLSLALHRAMGVFAEPAAPVVSLLCLAGATLPLIWRRTHPATVTLVVAGFVILMGELEVSELLVRDIALFMALYSLGAWHRPSQRARLVRWGVITAMALWLLVSFFRLSLDPSVATDSQIVGEMTPALALMLYQLLVNLLFFAGAIWFGHLAWESARRSAQLRERAEQLAAERSTVAAQAVALDRLHIARELHDSVAHHVSLMGVQAAAARTMLLRDPAAAESSIRLVENSARHSVEEMHTLLGILRQQPNASSGTQTARGTTQAASASPTVTNTATSQLSADQIPQLVQEVTDSGLAARVEVLGEPVPLRDLVSLSLYRIAQEALTNARKHAGASAEVTVRLRYRPSLVELEVTDNGAGRRARTQRPGGHGIAGMEERAAAVGGTLVAQPTSDEPGFTVRAQFPLSTAADDLPYSSVAAAPQPPHDFPKG